MKKLSIATLAITLAVVSIIKNTDACSRVLWNNNGKAVVVGRTMDWSHTWNDIVFVYPRGQEMTGGVEDGLKWKSKYGSVGCSISPYAKKHGLITSKTVTQMASMGKDSRPTCSTLKRPSTQILRMTTDLLSRSCVGSVTSWTISPLLMRRSRG